MSASTGEAPAPWALPKVEGPLISRKLRLEDLRAQERAVWEAGFSAGRDAALADSSEHTVRLKQKLHAQCEHLRLVLEYLNQPLDELGEAMHRQLVLACSAIARQVIRRELNTNPDEIVSAVRAAVALLPLASRAVRVQLHPEDARVVRECLGAASPESRWQLEEDPGIERGGCRVCSEYSTVDARVEQRIGAAVVHLLGDQRQSMSGAGDEAGR